MSRSISSLLVASLAVAAALVAACTPADPAARIAKIRSQYTVELNSWLPRPEEAAPAAGEAPEAAAGEAAVAEEGDAEEGTGDETTAGEEDGGPSPTRIFFDLVVGFEGREPLPGITVDITHASADEQVKEVRRHFIETPNLHRGGSQQIGFELDFPDFEEGDVFAVDVRQVVPPEERHLYPEFAEASGS
ncbi:MAG: hypothetical protein D6696_17265 [Acidobacteria bacterium]|nr:MAG: hypothetical protein D6696_17265 [Acidobacteriota bacterium]